MMTELTVEQINDWKVTLDRVWAAQEKNAPTPDSALVLSIARHHLQILCDLALRALSGGQGKEPAPEQAVGNEGTAHRSEIRVAEDAINLFLEYRDKHGHEEQAAIAAALNEFSEAQSEEVAALRQPPEGYKLAPAEPTEEMYRATDGLVDAYGFNHKTKKPCLTYETLQGVYKAMLAAAPSAERRGG